MTDPTAHPVTHAAMTGPGAVQTSAQVLATKVVGAYHHLSLVAPGVGERSRPGSFLAVSVGDGHLARRSFWIHRVVSMGGHRAVVEIVVEPRGPGSRALAVLSEGARVEVTGPLGRPFALPREPVRCLLVGEGYAAAALTSLAERLRERRCGVRLVLGGPDDAHVLEPLAARRSVGRVEVAVGDVTAAVLRSLPDADVVYAAAPAATLGFLAEAVARSEVSCQIALERPLTCATGLCQGCPVPVLDDSGEPHVVRACVDGPVFRSGRVDWGALA
jgi:dihydroorotate dehydrogenase electron transfer subunit